MEFGEVEPADEEYEEPPPSSPKLGTLFFTNAALAISSLVVGLATLGEVQDAAELADAKVFAAHHPNELDAVRISSAFRLVLGAIALSLAVIAAMRIRRTTITHAADPNNAEPGEAPAPWLRGLTGAALIVSVIAIVGAAIAFIYALQAHVGSAAFGG